MMSNVTIRLEAGATLLGAKYGYDPPEPNDRDDWNVISSEKVRITNLVDYAYDDALAECPIAPHVVDPGGEGGGWSLDRRAGVFQVASMRTLIVYFRPIVSRPMQPISQHRWTFRWRPGVAGALATAVLLLLAQVAHFVPIALAASPESSQSTAGLDAESEPTLIAEGADGGMWFTDDGNPAAIGAFTPCPYCAAGPLTPTITEFSAGLNPGSAPSRIGAGSEGDLWFTDDGATKAIGRIGVDGEITEFSDGLSSGSDPVGIAEGPEGDMWFADDGSIPAIGRVTPSGSITEFTAGLRPGSAPLEVAQGADHNLWFTDQGSTAAIGRITPSGSITEFSSGLRSGSRPVGIAGGPDGNLWFTDSGFDTLGQITTGGSITEFTGTNWGSEPHGIAAGPIGNLWITNPGPSKGELSAAIVDPPCPTCLLFNFGTASEFSAGLNSGARPLGIASGPDGNVWFTDPGSVPAIGRITTPPTIISATATVTGPTSLVISGAVDGHVQPTSVYAEYYPGEASEPHSYSSLVCYNGMDYKNCEMRNAAIITSPAQSFGATGGETPFRIEMTGVPGLGRGSSEFPPVRVIATNPTETVQTALFSYRQAGAAPPSTPSSGAGATPTARPSPAITKVRETHTVWRETGALAEISRRHKALPTGTSFSFLLNERAGVHFVFTQRIAGRLVGHTCRSSTSALRHRRTCQRVLTRGTLAFTGHPGANVVSFHGRLSRAVDLEPGSYALLISVANANGHAAAPPLVFTIVK
jgi:streptogramin lyase